MLSNYEIRNINRRKNVLNYIFRIEDVIVRTIKNYFNINKINIDDFLLDTSLKKKFLGVLNHRAKKNTSLSKTFSQNKFHIQSFLENATLGDVVAILEFTKVALKRSISPNEWNFKQTLIILRNITKLRNKASHSSFKMFDDLIYALPEIHTDIVGDNKGRQEQYRITLEKLLSAYGSRIKNVCI